MVGGIYGYIKLKLKAHNELQCTDVSQSSCLPLLAEIFLTIILSAWARHNTVKNFGGKIVWWVRTVGSLAEKTLANWSPFA